MPRVVSAASNHFWAADSVAQIVASPGAAPVMHPQRLYVRDDAVVLGDPNHADVDPCRSHAALKFLKQRHQVNLGTGQRPTRMVPRWAAATPAAEAFLRRADAQGRLRSPMVPPDLVTPADRRRHLAEMAARRRGTRSASEVEAERDAGYDTRLRPDDVRPTDPAEFERGESSDGESRGGSQWEDEEAFHGHRHWAQPLVRPPGLR
jgi:hypothetical protein